MRQKTINKDVITLSNLNLKLSTKTILKDLSVRFKSGELSVVLGPNGTGKSSLLKMITREWKSDKANAQISYFGQQAEQWQPENIAKHLGVLPQSSNLTFNFKVQEVVQLGGLTLSASDTEINMMVERNMQLTDISHLADRLYPSLSGGEKQRVHFARVLTQLEQSGEQKILLLDEPTAALDLSHQHKTLALAKQLAEQGAAVIIVMHDLNLAAQYADRLLMLNQGTIVADGSPWQVLTEHNIASVYNWDVTIMPHPEQGYPLVLS